MPKRDRHGVRYARRYDDAGRRSYNHNGRRNIMEKLFGAWFVFCALASIAWVGFIIWVIVKLMQHFGVI